MTVPYAGSTAASLVRRRCGPAATVKLVSGANTTGEGIRAGHLHRPRRLSDRHPGRKHPVRPMASPGLLRFVVRLPRQQRPGLGRPRRLRLPLRLASAQGPLRSEAAGRARQQGRGGAAARLPGSRPQTGVREVGLPQVLRDHRRRQASDQRPQGRPGRDDHRAAGTGRRADRRLRPGGLRRHHHRVQHERLAPAGPGHAGRGVRPHRRPPAAVLGRNLVSDGLRHARARQGRVRQSEAPARNGPLPPVHRRCRCDVGDPVSRAALLPGPGAARSSTTITATRRTSSPTRWCSWIRCADTVTTADC